MLAFAADAGRAGRASRRPSSTSSRRGAAPDPRHGPPGMARARGRRWSASRRAPARDGSRSGASSRAGSPRRRGRLKPAVPTDKPAGPWAPTTRSASSTPAWAGSPSSTRCSRALPARAPHLPRRHGPLSRTARSPPRRSPATASRTPTSSPAAASSSSSSRATRRRPWRCRRSSRATTSPSIGVIEPGARAAVARTRNRRVGVIATEGTIASGAYQRALRAPRPRARDLHARLPAARAARGGGLGRRRRRRARSSRRTSASLRAERHRHARPRLHALPAAAAA